MAHVCTRLVRMARGCEARGGGRRGRAVHGAPFRAHDPVVPHARPHREVHLHAVRLRPYGEVHGVVDGQVLRVGMACAVRGEAGGFSGRELSVRAPLSPSRVPRSPAAGPSRLPRWILAHPREGRAVSLAVALAVQDLK